MEDNKENDIKKQTTNVEGKDASVRTLKSRILRVLMWIVLSPVLLFVFLSILIYLPPVQRLAVNWASGYLSEEMGMDVTVEDVCLKFPLDLRAGGMVAVQDGDTILNAEKLDVSVRLVPLFKSVVEIDGVCLYNVCVYTRDMVEACLVKGFVGEMGLNSHVTSLEKEEAVLSKVWVKNADLAVVLADSVPEDTTESEPLNWVIRLEDIKADNVNLKLNTGRWDSIQAKWIVDKTPDAMNLKTHLGNAYVKGNIDLGKEVYQIDKVKFGDMSVAYSNMVSLKDMNGEVDSIVYKGTGDLSLAIRHLDAKEKAGLHVVDVKGHVLMDSLKLSVPDMTVLTTDSKIAMNARMDFNAFDSINPGTFLVGVDAQIGKGDILTSTKMAEPFLEPGTDLKDVRQMLVQYLPAKPLEVEFEAEGNLIDLYVNKLHAFADHFIKLDATASLERGAQLKADAKATIRSSRARLSADYNLNTEKYRADVTIDGFRTSDWVRMEEPLLLSGTIKANGQGTDIYSPRTKAFVNMVLDEARMGKINLSSTTAEFNLENNNLALNLTCSNDVLQTAFDLSGEVKKNSVDANLNIDLPYIDIHGMGLYEDTLKVSTQGQFSLNTNMKDLLKCAAHVDGLNMLIAADSVTTNDFNLHAETTVDSTFASLYTGDLSFDFHTPYNILKLMDKFVVLGNKAQKQIKDKALNIDELKTYFPELFLNAQIGTQNPLATVLHAYGVTFTDMMADVNMGPERGVVGMAHLYGLRYDTISVDTSFVNIYQEGRRIAYKAGVSCSDQPMFEAFSAYLDGYFAARSTETHLTFYNKKKEKGIDLGFRSYGKELGSSDTLTTLVLFPEQPILAYRKFQLNENNYVTFFTDKHIDCDVRLQSLSDSCAIALTAGLNNYRKQWANASIQNLNLAEIVSVVPFLPKMTGLLYLDAMFNQNENDDNFWVGGSAGVKKYTYEGMNVGDLEADFDYKPDGLLKHTVQGQVAYNGVDVAYLNGTYTAENDGVLDASLSLLDIPVSLVNPFIPDQLIALDGTVAGEMNVRGPVDRLIYNGSFLPNDVKLRSDMYSLRLGFANDTINIKNSKLMFDRFSVYAADKTPITINGSVDFADLDNMGISLGIYGKNFKLIESKRTGKSVLFGDAYGDFFCRMSGTLNDLSVRGMVNVLSSTNVTYIMTETPLSQGDRLEDIVTFVDLSKPIGADDPNANKSIMGLDMNITLNVEDGAKVNCEFSADRQSYIYVRGGGSLAVTSTPEGVFSVLGRLTVNDGEMKYTLPVIPLKTFTIESGSYVEFTGDVMNPILNIVATERTKAAVSSDGATRSVVFDVGMKITNSLSNMGLAFTIDAPTDGAIRSELEACTDEEKNKLAVALLATGMYISDSNTSTLTANNALNTFLQSEINNIAGKALNSFVDVSLGIDQTTYSNGDTGTDYSFKFSKRFFNDRLTVVIGGRVSDNKANSQSSGIGSFIDDVSLEWRLDNSATRYVRLFHGKDFENVMEGVLEKNGAGAVFRKKVDKWTDLFLFKK